MTYRDYHRRPSFDRQFAESEGERSARLREARLKKARANTFTQSPPPDDAIAKNCANWKDGTCETCGVPWQYFEVSADYKCKNFKRRD